MAYWTQSGTNIVASDAAASDEFGRGVAISRNGLVMVVGAAKWEDTTPLNRGGIYTYDRVDGAWVQRGGVFTPAGLSADSEFGTQVALDGDGTNLVIIGWGKWWDYTWSGSAWVLRSGTTAGFSLAAYDASLSADGTILALALAGSNLNLYDWSGSAWVARGTKPAYIDEVYSVALNDTGTRLATGHPYNDTGASNAGVVRVWELSGSWSQLGSNIAHPDPNINDFFGQSVALSADGDFVLIGSPGDASVYVDAGVVFLYEYDAGWAQVADSETVAPDEGITRFQDYFGHSLAASSNFGIAVIGAYGYNGPPPGSVSDSGTVYTFTAVPLGAVEQLVDDLGVTAESWLGSIGLVGTASDAFSITDSADTYAASFLSDLVRYAVTVTPASNTGASLIDTAAVVDVARQLLEQIVADIANSTVLLNPGIALQLIDLANATTAHVPTYDTVMAVAELIATAELYNGADGYDIAETGNFAEAFAARVGAIAAILDAAQVLDVGAGVVTVFQLQTDIAAGTDTFGSTGSIITALLDDTTLAAVRLNIGGELFTGWVMNTDTLAASEYQFVDRQFNSACKHDDQYLMAAEDGIYAFTEEQDVESVMTYIKTGKMDFGSDLQKRIVNSYIVYSASGDMVLKVTTSEFGQLVTRNYKMVPPSNSETTDTRRFDLGKGIRSRYWQFELVGDSVDCDLDEIGMLPVLLSRRI